MFSPIDFSNLRLIFLDIDGVLNSIKTLAVYGTRPGIKENRKAGEPYVEHNDAFDHLSIGLVNQLCKVTGAHIVLSSTWRSVFDFRNTVLMMDEIGIDTQYVIGRTDQIGYNRGYQIKRFHQDIQTGKESLDKMMDNDLISVDKVYSVYPENVRVESYVIIDDLEDLSVLDEQLPFLVKTNDLEGLTCADAIQAGKILTDDDDFYINAIRGLPNAGSNTFLWF